MTDRTPMNPQQPGRRRALQQAASVGALAATPAWVTSAFAQGDDLAPYRSAKMNWKQVEGESISVAVIPASYFDNLLSLLPQFEALTGVKVRAEKVPPGQIRQKAMLDLSSKTTTYATHAADPMYYPLYVANKWVEPLDKYLNDATLTDAAWYNYNDILKAWRDADSIDGKPYGIPYDGEVTVQVYRKDLYDAKGLHPANTYDQLLSNAKALHDPANRVYGLAMRGFSGAGQNMYIYPSLFRGFGGNWFNGKDIVVNSPEAVKALEWYVSALTSYAPPAVRNWNWPDIADAFSQGTVATYLDAHSSAAVLMNPGEVQGDRQGGLRPLAPWAQWQACHVDLELGFPDQCGVDRKAEEGDVALHPVGDVGRDAGAYLLEVRGAGQALGRQSALRVEVGRVLAGGRRRGGQLHCRRARIPGAGHRRRMASARAAVARHWRDDGHGHPVGAGRPEEAQGSAGRGAGAHPADPEGLSTCKWQ